MKIGFQGGGNFGSTNIICLNALTIKSVLVFQNYYCRAILFGFSLISLTVHYDDFFFFTLWWFVLFHGLENRILEPYFFYSLHFMHRFIRCVSSRMKYESKVNFIHLLKPIKKKLNQLFCKEMIKICIALLPKWRIFKWTPTSIIRWPPKNVHLFFIFFSLLKQS